jgi:RNA polymerase-binding transcription factor DksA
MVDAIDRAVAAEERQLEDALAHHARRAKPAGRETCANLDCEAPIAPMRQEMGAQLCIDCAREEERQQGGRR